MAANLSVIMGSREFMGVTRTFNIAGSKRDKIAPTTQGRLRGVCGASLGRMPQKVLAA